MRRRRMVTLGLILSCVLLRNARCAAPQVSPADWPVADREKYALLNLIYDLPRPRARAERVMIAGTSGPLAIHAGLVVLKQAGTAADAPKVRATPFHLKRFEAWAPTFALSQGRSH